MRKKQLPVGSAQAGTCVRGKLDHHWQIAPANGSKSVGRCGKCKKEALFFKSTQAQADYEKSRSAKKQVQVPTVTGSPQRAAA